MEDKVVSIIGGAGFLGRYVVQTLAIKGLTIHVYSRNPSKATFLKGYGKIGQINCHYFDITDPSTIDFIHPDTAHLINCVGILWESGKNQAFDEIHCKGGLALAKLCKQRNMDKFIHVSALGVDQNADSLYAKSKREGEDAILQAFTQSTIIRPSLIFGAEDNFFNLFSKLASLTPVLPLIKGGTTKFQPVFVGDVAEAIMNIVLTKEYNEKIYELGGVGVYSFKELLELMLKIKGIKRYMFPLPDVLAQAMAYVNKILPKPFITMDQLRLLEKDNILSGKYKGFGELGITAKSLESILPSYII